MTRCLCGEIPTYIGLRAMECATRSCPNYVEPPKVVAENTEPSEFDMMDPDGYYADWSNVCWMAYISDVRVHALQEMMYLEWTQVTPDLKIKLESY